MADNEVSKNFLGSIDLVSVLIGIIMMWIMTLVLKWVQGSIGQMGTRRMGYGDRGSMYSSKYGRMKGFNRRRALLPEVPPPYPGLYNLGQTCYANTIIQSLYFVPYFRALVLAMDYPQDLEYDSSGALVSNVANEKRFLRLMFQSLFYEMQRSSLGIEQRITRTSRHEEPDEVPIYDPVMRTSAGKKTGDSIDSKDASFEADTSASSVSKKSKLSTKHGPGLDRSISLVESQRTVNPENLFHALGIKPNIPEDVQEAYLMIMDRLENALSGFAAGDALSELYQGELAKVISCTKIKHESVKVEHFFDISLEVRGIGSLEAALSRFLAPELLSGSNEYQTDKHGKQEASLQYRIQKLPPILTFNLKRFRYDVETERRFKITSRFTFPLELNLGPYVKSTKKSSRVGSEQLRYVLLAVFTHEQQYGSGHYYCFLKDPSDPSSHWIEMNDIEVNFVNEYEAVDDNFGGNSMPHCAYRLQYVRVDQIENLFRVRFAEPRSKKDSESPRLTPSPSSKSSLPKTAKTFPVHRSFTNQMELFKQSSRLFESQGSDVSHEQ